MARRLLHCLLHREKPYIRVRNFCNAFVTIQKPFERELAPLRLSPPDLKSGASAIYVATPLGFEPRKRLRLTRLKR
jgi:hypothetical protein